MSKRLVANTGEIDIKVSQYLSPRQLAVRWDCSRTTAQRIADRAGISKYFLGEGRNGIVRYAINDIEAFEGSRRISSQEGRS
jgi:hypothetical protein